MDRYARKIHCIKKSRKNYLIFLFYIFKNILTHSFSRVVLKTLQEAYKKNGAFHVYVTESCPDKSGIKLKEELLKLPGVTATLILDSSVGSVMEKIDFVLLGAEGNFLIKLIFVIILL